MTANPRRNPSSWPHAEFVETTIKTVHKERKDTDSYDTFVAEDGQRQKWHGRTIVVATGNKDIFLELPGYAENWPNNM